MHLGQRQVPPIIKCFCLEGASRQVPAPLVGVSSFTGSSSTGVPLTLGVPAMFTVCPRWWVPPSLDLRYRLLAFTFWEEGVVR